MDEDERKPTVLERLGWVKQGYGPPQLPGFWNYMAAKEQQANRPAEEPVEVSVESDALGGSS